MTALRRVEPSLAHLAALADHMSPTERWLFGLGGNPGEADARAENRPLDNLAAPVAAGVGGVARLQHVGVGAGADQSLGLRLVHDDEGETEAFEPVSEKAAHPPEDAPAVGAVGSFSLGVIAVGPADPVVELLLADAERLTTTPQNADEVVFVSDDRRLHSHLTPQQKEAPRDA